MPAKLGPSSIAGNIRMPVNFGSGPGWKSLGAATKNAALHEIANVIKKYVTAGCFRTNEVLTGELDS